MTKTTGSGGPRKPPTGDYPVGRGKPPDSGKIKPGEVRNPHGRSGKPKPAEDPFEEASRRSAKFTLDGVSVTGTAIYAGYLMLMSKALKGDPRALSLMSREQLARLAKGAPPPTAEEVADTVERERLEGEMRAGIVKLLSDLASLKKSGVIDFIDGRAVVSVRVTAALARADSIEANKQ